MYYYNLIKNFKILIIQKIRDLPVSGLIRFFENHKIIRVSKRFTNDSTGTTFISLYPASVSHIRGVKTMVTMIGRVIHYYPKICVAAVIREDHIPQGDRIHIRGPHDDVHQSVNSMECEHVPINEAERGQDIGIRVTEQVHPGNVVFREI